MLTVLMHLDTADMSLLQGHRGKETDAKNQVGGHSFKLMSTYAQHAHTYRIITHNTKRDGICLAELALPDGAAICRVDANAEASRRCRDHLEGNIMDDHGCLGFLELPARLVHILEAQ